MRAVGSARCERGVVGSGRLRGGRGRGRGGRAVRGVRAPVQQRVQPAPARAAHPRGAAGGVRHVRPQLQDAAVPAAPHARAAPARAHAPQAAASAPRAAARSALPPVVGERALSYGREARYRRGDAPATGSFASPPLFFERCSRTIGPTVPFAEA